MHIMTSDHQKLRQTTSHPYRNGYMKLTHNSCPQLMACVMVVCFTYQNTTGETQGRSQSICR